MAEKRETNLSDFSEQNYWCYNLQITGIKHIESFYESSSVFSKLQKFTCNNSYWKFKKTKYFKSIHIIVKNKKLIKQKDLRIKAIFHCLLAKYESGVE